MLYRIAHIVRDRIPWLWDVMGVVLSCLFKLRYGRKLKQVPLILERYSCAQFVVKTLNENNVSALAKMFREQPEIDFEYFRPHGFTEEDLQRLVRDNGFLAYVVMHKDIVVGYFFQRSFFWGKAYRGYITDCRWRRKGINRLMNECATEIASYVGLQVFGSISPENIASLKSAEAVNEIRIVRTLSNGDYYVQYLPRKKYSSDRV